MWQEINQSSPDSSKNLTEDEMKFSESLMFEVCKRARIHLLFCMNHFFFFKQTQVVSSLTADGSKTDRRQYEQRAPQGAGFIYAQSLELAEKINWTYFESLNESQTKWLTMNDTRVNRVSEFGSVPFIYF